MVQSLSVATPKFATPPPLCAEFPVIVQPVSITVPVVVVSLPAATNRWVL